MGTLVARGLRGVKGAKVGGDFELSTDNFGAVTLETVQQSTDFIFFWDTSANALRRDSCLRVGLGGTGLSYYAAGDMLYASASDSLAKLPKAAAGNALLSGNTPSWGKVTEGHIELADSTDLDVSTSAHGFVPKATGETTKYLRADGAWSAVSDVFATRPALHNANYVPQWSAVANAGILVNGFEITAAGKAILDDADNTAQRATLGLGNSATKDVGAVVGTVAAGDDSRFVTNGNSHDHIDGDGAAITEGAFNFTNVVTANVSAVAHGLCPILPNDATLFLDGTGNWTEPPGGGTGTQILFFEDTGLTRRWIGSGDDASVNINLGSGETVIETFIVDTSFVNAFIPIGKWKFRSWFYVSDGTDGAFFYYRVYKRDEFDVDTELFNTSTTIVQEETPTEYETEYEVETMISLDPLQRLVVKVSAWTVSAALIDCHFTYSANIYGITPSRIETTLPVQIPNFVYGPSSAVSGNFASYDGTTGELLADSGYSAASFITLDQTTPQTFVNGTPLLESTRVIDDQHELVDKAYVDEAVTSLGVRFYMTNTGSGVTQPVSGEEYKLTAATSPAAFDVSYAGLTDGQYIVGWISPVGGAPSKLLAGVYDWHVFLEKTAGIKTLRVYWTLVERSSLGVETVVETSSTSDLISAKERFRVPLVLDDDFTVPSGSRVIGKLYAVVGPAGSAPTLKIYGGGTDDSHWEIPANKEIYDNVYLGINEQYALRSHAWFMG